MSKSRLIGLRELVAAAKPHECPFCGEPRKKREGHLHFGQRRPGPGRPAKGAPEGYDLTCGDPECKETAYSRYICRDARARNRKRKQRMSVASGTPSP